MSTQYAEDMEAAAARADLHLHEQEAKAAGVKPVDHTLQLHSAHLSKEDEKDLDVTDGDYLRPTEEERVTLRRVPEAIPYTAFLIALCELSERFSYYGCTVVFQNFIQYPAPSPTGAGYEDGQSGAMNQGQQTATGLTTFNSFWVYCMPLVGAYLADTHWGRFKTICIAVAVALVGHVLLIISAIPEVIANSAACMAVFILAIITMGAGTGAFKSCVSPLIAEQVKGTKQSVATLKSGERVIVDPTLTTARIFMYFYLFINIGSLVGQIGMSFSEKYVGFYLAFLLPTVVFLLNPIVLWIGRNRYVKSPPSGSVLAESLRLLKFASRGRFSWNPVRTFKNLKTSDFWESAKPSQIAPSERPSWMASFDDKWVDEVRRGFKACQVFCFFPLYWLSYNQITNNLTSQAATMSTHGLPNEIISNLNPLSLVIMIPIFDLVLYPFLRKVGINFTPLKRMALGFQFGAAAMIWAAVLQYYVYQTSPCGYNAGGTIVNAAGEDEACEPSYLNVWIQSGPYILIGISEIFASITGLEYAFTKAPRNMRSLVMSVFLFTSAIASALQQAFVALATDPLLIWNYGVFAVLAFLGGVGFWICFRHLDKEEDDLNQLDEGGYKTN